MTGNKALHRQILDWYQQNQRPLPWRKDKNPYKIWISEVMLQQTTIQAVVPYFERFLKNFPDVNTLANSKESEVLKNWAGLGYYSRARNIHKAAQKLSQSGFPQSYSELIQYPGFGPYTSRAVTSIAFDEPVGVVDGNVIRLTSRILGENIEWWKTAGKNRLQDFVDDLAVRGSAGDLNQALMDIGSTICTPTSPSCLLCPCKPQCQALKNDMIDQLPLKKAKREREIWLWQPDLIIQKGKLAMTQTPYTPFLKGHWLPPGKISRKKTPPKKYHFKHSITHHDIFVDVQNKRQQSLNENSSMSVKWISIKQMSEYNPTSLIQKVLKEK